MQQNRDNIFDDLENQYNITKKAEQCDFCSSKSSSSRYCNESICSKDVKVKRLSFEDWIHMKPEYARKSSIQSNMSLSPNA